MGLPTDPLPRERWYTAANAEQYMALARTQGLLLAAQLTLHCFHLVFVMRLPVRVFCARACSKPGSFDGRAKRMMGSRAMRGHLNTHYCNMLGESPGELLGWLPCGHLITRLVPHY